MRKHYSLKRFLLAIENNEEVARQTVIYVRSGWYEPNRLEHRAQAEYKIRWQNVELKDFMLSGYLLEMMGMVSPTTCRLDRRMLSGGWKHEPLSHTRISPLFRFAQVTVRSAIKKSF